MTEIQIKNFNGVIVCKFSHGKYYVHCDYTTCTFKQGATLLQGPIDGGSWAISYVLSMYRSDKKSFLPLEDIEFFADGNKTDLRHLQSAACYLDRIFPLFRSRKSVKAFVEKELKRRHDNLTAEDVRRRFNISPFRFERPLKTAGNELFRSMAAMGYAAGKSIFCFPWFSVTDINYFGRNITDVAEVLTALNKIVLLPTEYVFPSKCTDRFFNNIYRVAFKSVYDWDYAFSLYSNDDDLHRTENKDSP